MKRRNMIRLGMGKEGMKAVEMGPGKVAWIIGYGSPPRSKVSQAISAKPVWMMLATFRFWALFYPFMFCGCLCWLLLPGQAPGWRQVARQSGQGQEASVRLFQKSPQGYRVPRPRD